MLVTPVGGSWTRQPHRQLRLARNSIAVLQRRDYRRIISDAAISFTNVQDEEHIVEVTVTGKEDCSGASMVLDDNRSPCLARVQIPGTALRVAMSDILADLPAYPICMLFSADINCLS